LIKRSDETKYGKITCSNMHFSVEDVHVAVDGSQSKTIWSCYHVCPSICKHDYSKSRGWMLTKFLQQKAID